MNTFEVCAVGALVLLSLPVALSMGGLLLATVAGAASVVLEALE